MPRLAVEAFVHRAGRGSSEPWVAAATDGARYVVKFRGAGPGPQALVAEMVVNTLAIHWGYPVPAARPIWLGPSVPRVGTDELWDVLDASAGWNLGIAWIADANNVALADHPSLDAAATAAIAVIDPLFVNLDRTTLSNNVLVDAAGTHWLIDHGSCLFAGRLAEERPVFELAVNHFLRDAPPAPAVPPPTDATAIAAVLAPMPRDWLDAVGLGFDELVAGLARRVAAFIRARAGA